MEVPQDQLDKVFEEDEVLQGLMAEGDTILVRYERDMKKRAALAIEVHDLWISQRKESKRLESEANRNKRRFATLRKKKKPPHMLEMQRRITRRKGVLRKRELKRFLATQRDSFLKQWNENQN